MKTYAEINEIALCEEAGMCRNARDQITTAFVHGFKYCERMQEQKKAEQLQAEYNAGYKRGCYDRERLAKEADNAHQRGLEEAWEAARKVMVAKLKGGMSNKEIRECFDDLEWMDSQDLIRRYSASEIIEKIRAYEEKRKQEEPQFAKVEIDDMDKCCTCIHDREYYCELDKCLDYEMYEKKQEEPQNDEIKIGDEVIYNGNAPHKEEKGFVIGLCGEWVEVRYLSSWNCVGVHKDTLKKTGRHFDGIEDALKKMRGEANE